jgi:uncharacterized protein
MILRGRSLERICLILFGLLALGWLYSVVRGRTLDSALLDAVKTGNTSLAESLLRRGANIEVRDNSTVWHNEGADFTPLALAVARNDQRLVKMLLARGANPNAKTQADGPFPARDIVLSTAAENGNVEIITLLLNAGGQVNTRAGTGVTPLMLAARDNHADAVRLLIQRGADVNAKDERGFSPLYFATGKNRQDHGAVVRILRTAGAKP